MSGQLIVVSTPIGNMGDLSPRAADTLRGADLIACEDTRRAGRLLELGGIEKRPLLRVDEHTQLSATERILDEISSGRTVALISDAGTPLVSDPGELVVAAVLGAGLSVSVVPGPSAVLAALVVSGLGSDRFCFEGFLPRKGPDRAARIGLLLAEPRTTVFYESPNRLAKTLGDLATVLEPDRRISLARELTKLHEQLWSGTLGCAVERAASFSTKGEYVLVIDGCPADRVVSDVEILAALAAETDGSTRSQVDAVASELGVSRRRVYTLAHRPG